MSKLSKQQKCHSTKPMAGEPLFICGTSVAKWRTGFVYRTKWGLQSVDIILEGITMQYVELLTIWHLFFHTDDQP